MNTLDFVGRRLGTRIDSVGGDGGECVDLVNQFLADMYGLPHVYRNAVDWAGLRMKDFVWIGNKPLNMPKAGDLAVWGQNAAAGTGPNGHIALVLSASPMWLVSFDQNWPSGAPAGLRLHTYDGVLGWQAHVPGANGQA